MDHMLAGAQRKTRIHFLQRKNALQSISGKKFSTPPHPLLKIFQATLA
jgi:hypothetical protein